MDGISWLEPWDLCASLDLGILHTQGKQTEFLGGGGSKVNIFMDDLSPDQAFDEHLVLSH